MGFLTNYRTKITGTAMGIIGVAGTMGFISPEMTTALGVVLTGLAAIFLKLGIENAVAPVAAATEATKEIVQDAAVIATIRTESAEEAAAATLKLQQETKALFARGSKK